MQQRPLGRTSLKVSAIGFGGMPLSIHGRPPERDAIRVLHAALDAGMTLVDTADVYCLDDGDLGHNERLVARALASWPSSPDVPVVVATKGGLMRPRGDWTTNGRPEHLQRACEASLTALGIETIDLYQLHAPDPAVSFADSVGALVRLKEQGKVRHVGLSNVGVDEVETASALVEIASVQNRCNPFDRQPFLTGLVDHCARGGITFLAHSPVGGHRGHSRTKGDPVLAGVARRHGATPYEVCIAWLLAASPVIVPIPGASRVDSAESSARASGIELTPRDLEELDAAFPRTPAGA